MACRAITAGLFCCALLVLSLGLTHAAPATGGARQHVAIQFVTAANRGDYGTVCRLYSARYLKSQASCRSLYRWGAGLYGPYDYRIVRWRTLQSGHWRVDLTRWQQPSFIELEHQKTGWRIVAGGW
jgi:hypothetical protein